MRTTTQLLAATLLAAATSACAAGGGTDDDPGATTAETVDTATAEAGDPAAAAETADTDAALCDAAAALFGLPEQATDADAAAVVERLVAAVPAEVAGDLETVLDAMGSGDPLGAYADEGYVAADAAITDAVLADCDGPALDVDAADYAFEGLPETLEAGRVVLEVTNTSTTELHELSLLRRNDDVDASFEELFELPDDEASASVTAHGSTVVGPGGRTVLVADLPPGDYLVACFLPVGSGDPSPDAEPHLARGMWQQLTVTD